MQPSSTALQNYQNYQTSRIKPEDYVKKYASELGVDDARARVKSARSAIKATEDTIAATPDSVAGRTSGSLVTDAQRNRLVQNEVAPLQEVMRTQSGAYGEASQDASTLTNDLNQRVDLALKGDDSQANTLLTLYQASTEAEKQAEAQRQFNAELAIKQAALDETKRSNAASAFNPTIGGGGGAAADKLPAGMTAKAAGLNGEFKGYAFSGKNGQPVSAATFAAQNNIPLGELLYKMAGAGDSTAANAYKWIQSIQGTDMFKNGSWKNTPAYRNNFSSLFWGA